MSNLNKQTARPFRWSLILDCSQPFIPIELINKDLRVWLGPADGDGQSGEPDIDPRADSLDKVDFGKALFEHCFKESKSSIIGEEKLRQLKERESEVIRHGGQQFQALWCDWKKNGEQSVLEYLRKTSGITYMDFMGLVLRDPVGSRCVLYLDWNEGVWNGYYFWLDEDFLDRSLSVSSPAS